MMAAMREEKLMETTVDIKTAAALLEVTPRTLINYIKGNLFPGAYKLNPLAKRRAEWRIPMDAIEAFKGLRSRGRKQ